MKIMKTSSVYNFGWALHVTIILRKTIKVKTTSLNLVAMWPLLCLLFLASCETQDIVIVPESAYAKREFQNGIASVKEFTKAFVNTYSNILEEKVSPAYRDSFPFGDDLKVYAIISSTSGAFINILPSKRDSITIYCTDLPAQLKLIANKNVSDSIIIMRMASAYTGKDSLTISDLKPHKFIQKQNRNTACNPTVYMSVPDSMRTNLHCSNYPKQMFFSKNPVNIAERYNALSGCFPSGDTYFGFTELSRLIFHSGIKPFNLCEESIFLLSDSIQIESGGIGYPFTILIEHIGFIIGKTDFYRLREDVDIICLLLINTHVQKLFLRSEFFNRAQADHDLRPLAQEIVRKQSRSQLERDFDYPPSEKKKDMDNLRQQAINRGISDDDYPEILIDYESLKVPSGNLLWYYETYNGFILQWSLINLIAILASILMTVIFRRYKDVLTIIIALFQLINIGGNTWAFYKKPESLPITYWIIPGLLFFVSFYIIGKLGISLKLRKR
jgi:hypothetical protein